MKSKKLKPLKWVISLCSLWLDEEEIWKHTTSKN
jgi:hypothetical protein